MKTLKQCRPGQRVRVSAVTGSGSARRRILDMGVTQGTSLEVRKAAPFGDPIEINVRGFELTLRKSECAMIAVEELERGIAG